MNYITIVSLKVEDDKIYPSSVENVRYSLFLSNYLIGPNLKLTEQLKLAVRKFLLHIFYKTATTSINK